MHLANSTLLELAQQHGSPLYVYDADLIRKRYRELYEFIPYPKLQILYAMKANYNPGILGLLRDEGCFIDAVSPAEVLMCRRLNFGPERILYTANNFTDEEMHLVQGLGVMFNIGSLSELARYGKSYPGARVCLRFNPAVVAGANEKIQTAGDLTKFGILLSDLEQAREIVLQHNLHVVGIHEHTGSGIKEMDKFIKAMTNTLALAKREFFPELEFVDFGGGFGVPYRPEEERVNYAEFGKKVVPLFEQASKEYGNDLKIYFEPGRYIVCEGGYLILQVNTIKNNNGRLIAGTNSGFPQLIRPMMYDAYHHIVNLSNPTGPIKTYDICGNICETGDRFGMDREMPEVREGDYLCIQNAGAYCYAMGGVYNMRAMPTELIVSNEHARVIRKQLREEELVKQILGECANY